MVWPWDIIVRAGVYSPFSGFVAQKRCSLVGSHDDTDYLSKTEREDS